MNPEEFILESESVAKQLLITSLSQYNEKMAICSNCRHRQGNSCNAIHQTDPYHFIPMRASHALVCPKGHWRTAEQKRDSETVKVSLLVPAAHNLGGIERWLIGMSKYLPLVSNGKVTVSSIIVQFGDKIGEELLPQLHQVARVVRCYDTAASKVEWHAALAESDVTIISCLGDAALPFLKDYKGKVVWLSHSCCEYSRQYCREIHSAGIVTHWSSVGHLASSVFPDDLAEKVVPMENGAEVERCTPVYGGRWQRKQWGIPNDKIIIGYIGRLHWEKRPTFLAEALVHLPENYMGVMVGSGIHEAGTREECDKLVGDRIKFVGRMNMIGDAMAAMNFGFLASPAEGFCLSRTEMQLAGLPMFSTPTGELPRLEQQFGKLCWTLPIFAPGPVMAGIIEAAVADQAATNEIALRARNISWDFYTAAAMAGRWSNWLQKIVKE